ncbi:MAG: ribonuclease E/G [Planktomarina sp.]|nr:ribonuclease E/G [Planktomarina sp.]
MKGKQVVLGHLGDAKVAALLVDGKLEDVLVEDLSRLPLGTILRAVVDRPVKGIGGAMLRLPNGTGFLKKAKGLAPGQAITVQTSGFAEAGKADPVNQRFIFKSRYAIVTPDQPGLNVSRKIRSDDLRDNLTMLAKSEMEGSNMGLIIRSSAALADMEDVVEDIQAMRASAEAISAEVGFEPEVLLEGDDPHVQAWREWSDVTNILTGSEDLEASGALDQIEAAQGSWVALGVGGMFVEQTRAMTTVDINTGADLSPAAALKVNLAAVQDLPRQLRLRGYSGQVAIDFAPMTKRDRKPIEVALRAALRTCPIATEFVGWTPLGHGELKRKRERAVLKDLLK